MLRIHNVVEARNLIARYEAITAEEIYHTMSLGAYKTLLKPLGHIALNLTGYGLESTCLLCKAPKVKGHCLSCIYAITIKEEDRMYEPYCAYGMNRDTYLAIGNAITVRGLIKAFKERAKHIRLVLEIYEDMKRQKEQK